MAANGVTSPQLLQSPVLALHLQPCGAGAGGEERADLAALSVLMTVLMTLDCWLPRVLFLF